ncbi:WD40-repeat-containing domain protein [Suillus occidentalis]|nr:WD40-repeat-containing domain protein [Suillus occidentalis]
MFFSPWFLFRKSTQRFQHQARLTMSGSVHALAASNDGQALACGGTEGIKIWDIKSRKELTCTSHNYESRGTVSCAVWITTRLAMTETLCYGTGLGYIVFLRRSPVDMLFQETCARRLGSGFEITCIAWDMTSEGSTRIAVGTRDKIVQSVAFADDKGVYVFGLYDGNFIKLKDDDGAVVKEYSCKSVIGHAAVNQKRGVFVVDNATDGFTLYRLGGDEEPVRTFVTAPPSVSVPKQVAFGAEGRLVVGGSDNGLVYIFERKTGKLLETLHQSDAGLVQTIATRDINGRCIVVSASQALRHKATVNLWIHDYGMKKETLTLKESWSLSCALTRIFTILIHASALLVTLCFLINYMNYDTMALSADLTQRMRSTRAFFADNLEASVREAVLDKVPHTQEKGHEKNDILRLHELAERLMEVVREAEGDVGEDVYESAMDEKDDIAAEAERVFFEALKVRRADIKEENSGGKDVILMSNM